MIERFTRVGPDTLDYEFTVTDPNTWNAPVEWFAADGALGRPGVRVRLPRGQLRTVQHADRVARRGRRSGGRSTLGARAAEIPQAM